MRYVLKNLQRDWSAEGEVERAQSYGRIIAELCERLPQREGAESRGKVLVPGAGLGRLCLELAARVSRSKRAAELGRPIVVGPSSNATRVL